MSLISKIKNFIKALYFHIGAGLPKASSEQILYRYSICQDCEMFEKINSQCLVCGCNISNQKIFLNKLAWADQECPLKKWNKINNDHQKN